MKLKNLLPPFLWNFARKNVHEYRRNVAEKKFNALDKISCNSDHLLAASSVSLERIFTNEQTDTLWQKAKYKIDPLGLPDGTGGVNQGDRRAIFYILSHFNPKTVLEVGTHIGASTIHIASAMALKAEQDGFKPQLVTLDIRDVNSLEKQPWLEFDSKLSPAAMMKKLALDSFVRFEVNDSFTFLSGPNNKFDFIFLDGDHSAGTVYGEVPLALKHLNDGGVILLHDFCPGGKKLWDVEEPIPGPWLAVKRLKAEGANLTVVPLGNLPWPTKHGTNLTSLALLLKNA